MPAGNPNFKKGVSGNPKGRPVGTKRKFINAISMMEERGFNPVEKLMDLYESTRDEKIKVSCLKELRACYAPTLRCVELNANNSHSYALNIIVSDKNTGKILDNLEPKWLTIPSAVEDNLSV